MENRLVLGSSAKASLEPRIMPGYASAGQHVVQQFAQWSRPAFVADPRRAAEFAADDDQRVFQQAVCWRDSAGPKPEVVAGRFAGGREVIDMRIHGLAKVILTVTNRALARRAGEQGPLPTVSCRIGRGSCRFPC